MKIWLPAMALSVALTVSVAVPSANAGGAIGGGAAGVAGHGMGGFHGHGFGFPHGFGFHRRFFRQRFPFHQSRLNFGAGFESHRSNVVTGGYGDSDYASDDDSDSYQGDDIDNLHFRVQEPFGPGDIGRPVRAEEDAPYPSDRMGPWQDYTPNG